MLFRSGGRPLPDGLTDGVLDVGDRAQRLGDGGNPLAGQCQAIHHRLVRARRCGAVELVGALGHLRAHRGRGVVERDVGAEGEAGGLHGLVEEAEDIRVFTLAADEAFAALADGLIRTAPAYAALLWLKTERDNLRRKWR